MYAIDFILEEVQGMIHKSLLSYSWQVQEGWWVYWLQKTEFWVERII